MPLPPESHPEHVAYPAEFLLGIECRATVP